MEVSVFGLWLPILLAAVLVFVVSSILHMALPIHKNDAKQVPGEGEVLEVMRKQGLQPGEYWFPRPASTKDCSSPEMIEKWKQGPVGWMTVIPNGPPAMGKSLAQWFVYCILMGLFAGYIATMGLGKGAAYGDVFRMTGTVAILGYAFSSVSNSIWKGTPWSITVKFIVDGIIYGLVTAGTFAWLWPEAL